MSKYLCLSFDDGPNIRNDTTMNDMLDYLESEKIPAKDNAPVNAEIVGAVKKRAFVKRYRDGIKELHEYVYRDDVRSYVKYARSPDRVVQTDDRT